MKADIAALSKRALALTIALTLAVTSNTEAQVAPSGTVVISGATLIDGTGAAPLADAAVLIVDGLITEVGRRGTVAVPEGARLIEAAGNFLLPGFVDTHAHVTVGPVEMDVSSGVPAMSLTVDPEVPRY